MKHFLISLLLVLFHSLTYSQDYSTIIAGDTNIFQYNKISLHHYYWDKTYYSIQVDSVVSSNSDKILYHFNLISLDPSKIGPCYIKRMPNWTGKKTLIKSNGDNIFFTRVGDTIRIKTLANLNENWHFYEFKNGNYYQAEVTDKTKGSVLGISDSIKVITIILKASDGSVIPDNFNGKQLILSKSYGLVKAYDFSLFPSDTGSIVIAGLSSAKVGVQNISARDIFDYDVDDELEIEQNNVAVDNYPGTLKKERRIVIGKQISYNGDTLKYLIKRILVEDYFDHNVSTHSYISDTVEEKIIYSENSELDLPPLKVDPYKGYAHIAKNVALLSNTSLFNNRLIKYSSGLIATENDTCFSMLLDINVYSLHYFINGLGGPYYNDDMEADFPYQNRRLLKYYKKGSETWGTPLDFSTGIASAKKGEISFSVFPNPFIESTTFKIDNPKQNSFSLTILDMLGNEVLKREITGAEINIPSNGLKKGVYMFKITGNGGEKGAGKLIVY